MCGICGIISFSQAHPVRKDAIERMNNELVHRGPDDGGVYVRQGACSVGLGHRRLSIIDLSVAGHQPMPNEDNSLWIVLNGEIYNFKEIRELAEKKGHRFSSHTDTEVILHLYEEYGIECLRLLRGMFAFALWDARAETLFLARDRIGKKPLLYNYSQGVFTFASEFASLLACGTISKEINHTALDHYLSFGYIPAPMSIYASVHKIPPAHYALVNKQGVVLKRYWQLRYGPKHTIPEQEAREETLRLMREAVGLRLCSDVPLGAFLSGGIDSSIVVALMAQASAHQKIKTFSIGFKDAPYNELGYAKAVAQRYHTDHHEFMLQPSASTILPLLTEHYGEPYADSSCIPTYYVAQQTKQFVTVALNGDGGDESFGGYDRYQAMLLAQQLGSGSAQWLLQKAKPLFADSLEQKNVTRRIRRFLDAASLPQNQRYLRWIGIFNGAHKDLLYRDEFSLRIDRDAPLRLISGFLDQEGDLCDRLLGADVGMYLPDDLLVKVDIASMACALEARSPLLDHVLMEFVARLPCKYKVTNFSKKILIKKIARRLIPHDNIYRKKMGFGIPLSGWLREELAGLVKSTLLSDRSINRGYFKKEALVHLVKQHLEGKQDYSYQLWSLMMLEMWHARYID